LGKPAEFIVGQTIKDSLTPLEIELSYPISEVRKKDQPILGIEIQPTLLDRGQVDLRINLSPLKDANKITHGIAIVLDDLTEKKQLEAQRQLFERMVPPAVIDQIDLNKIQLGGERANITTLFADIRGYTTFSESLTPEQLVSILNLYLGAAAEAVLDEDGTLDKFMGDAIMAIFNAPIPQKNHTLRAVKAALNFRDSINRVRRDLPPAFQLGFGIGIHCGDAVLGLVGTEKRLDYTAIGDSVNIAKRIQENAGEGQILISKPALDNVKDNIDVIDSDTIYAKGKKEPVEVFELIGIKN
jgi:class 3 adenylate cyclase